MALFDVECFTIVYRTQDCRTGYIGGTTYVSPELASILERTKSELLQRGATIRRVLLGDAPVVWNPAVYRA